VVPNTHVNAFLPAQLGGGRTKGGGDGALHCVAHVAKLVAVGGGGGDLVAADGPGPVDQLEPENEVFKHGIGGELAVFLLVHADFEVGGLELEAPPEPAQAEHAVEDAVLPVGVNVGEPTCSRDSLVGLRGKGGIQQRPNVVHGLARQGLHGLLLSFLGESLGGGFLFLPAVIGGHLALDHVSDDLGQVESAILKAHEVRLDIAGDGDGQGFHGFHLDLLL
jgi:hypothetical protein